MSSSVPVAFLGVLLIQTACSLDITTSYGTLRGTNITTSDGILVHIFKKIPQAQPPVGELRYDLPRRPKIWQGVLDATNYGPACMSNSTVSSSHQKSMSEDCLYLNVFVPANCLFPNTSCPVIVYLHGGKMSYDSPVMFDDSFIANEYSARGVIFVLPAMRLGSFGLLAFANKSIVPRNLPVYDIILGLEWVNKEISSFGGDNSKVTLMGHSMGAAIAYMLSISRGVDPEKKLFQRVVPLSGDVFFTSDEKIVNVSQRLLQETGCSLATESASFDCIRRLDAKILLDAQRRIEEVGFLFSGVSFNAPIGNPSVNYIEELESAPARDFLCGGTSREFGFKDDSEGLDIGRFLGLKHEKEVAAKFYSDMQSDSVASKFPSYLSQVVFLSNYRYGGAMVGKGAKVFLYEFAQPPSPSHARDMKYFIGAHRTPVESEDDVVLRNIYVASISNFAKGMKPLPGWRSFNGSDPYFFSLYSHISKNITPEMKRGYHEEIVNYWLQNMTQFDLELSEKESTNTPAFLFSAGLAITVVIFVALAVIFCRRRNTSAEKIPLLKYKECHKN